MTSSTRLPFLRDRKNMITRAMELHSICRHRGSQANDEQYSETIMPMTTKGKWRDAEEGENSVR